MSAVIRLARSTADTGVLDDDAWPLVGAGVVPDAGASSGMGGWCPPWLSSFNCSSFRRDPGTAVIHDFKAVGNNKKKW